VKGRGGPGEGDRYTHVFRALAVAVADRGIHAVKLSDVAVQAGLSSRALRERFADVEACFLAAFNWCTGRAGAALLVAYSDEQRWLDGARAGLAALLELIDQEPELARLWIVYSLGAGPRIQRRRAKALAVLCEYLDRGRLESAVRTEPPAVTAEGVIGAVMAVIQARLLATKPAPASELQGELMSLIVLPYLGGAAAKRELMRPPPRLSRTRLSGSSTIDSVGMRVTYRTARVLSAIAECPGANNREVGNRAEVADQGQISKLLSRLESQGLIVNMGRGGRRGSPNAWELTSRGEQIQHVIHYRGEAPQRSLP
jgi:AcrR family transcriptional regulator